MILLYLYKRLAILQQNSYRMYPKWIYKNYFKELLFYIVNLFFFNPYTYIISIILYLPFCKLKKRLIFTKRMVRLIIPILLIIIAMLNNYFIMERIGVVLIDLIIYLGLLINRFIEGFIYKKIYKNTRIKLNSFKGIKIGVCGSYGKTTLKNYLYEILSLRFCCFKTPESYNTPMGISKCLSNLELYDVLIIEMGISHYGDSDELINLVNPDIVILNNIGISHMNNFNSLEDLKNEKLKLLKAKTIFTGFKYDNAINYGECGYEFKNGGVYKNNEFLFDLNLNINYKIHNILGAIAVSDYLGIDINDIKEGIKNLKEIDNRYKVYDFEGFKLIDNSFNNNYIASFEMIDSLNYEKMAIITDGFVDINEKYNYLLFNKIYEKFDLIASNNKLFKSNKTIGYKNLKKLIKEISRSYNLILIENDLNDYYRGIL